MEICLLLRALRRRKVFARLSDDDKFSGNKTSCFPFYLSSSKIFRTTTRSFAGFTHSREELFDAKKCIKRTLKEIFISLRLSFTFFASLMVICLCVALLSPNAFEMLVSRLKFAPACGISGREISFKFVWFALRVLRICNKFPGIHCCWETEKMIR